MSENFAVVSTIKVPGENGQSIHTFTIQSANLQQLESQRKNLEVFVGEEEGCVNNILRQLEYNYIQTNQFLTEIVEKQKKNGKG